MVEQTSTNLWGIGIYSVGDATRLTDIPSSRIRRWIQGYRYHYQGADRTSPPVWHGQIPPLGRTVALGFLDLMELRIVDAFIQKGVSLKAVRLAVERAKQQFGVHHPFCTQRFKTDGRTIFLEIGTTERERELIDLVHNQYAFERVMRPYLQGVEYVDEKIVRWWPLGQRRSVVIDPSRSFGAPITARRGVPTKIIAKSVEREGNIESVMRWYQIERREVLDAVAYERSLAA